MTDAKLFVTHRDLINNILGLTDAMKAVKADFVPLNKDFLFRMTYDALYQYHEGLSVYIEASRVARQSTEIEGILP